MGTWNDHVWRSEINGDMEDHVWWLEINGDMEDHMKRCSECQQNRNAPAITPIHLCECHHDPRPIISTMQDPS